MRKRIASLGLAMALVLSLLSTAALAAEGGLANFRQVNSYADGTFTDVAAGSWFAGNVKSAYELDLMKGTSATAFSPDGSITVGSAIALACRLHSIYHTGSADFVQGEPWYQVYVDYAAANGIITQGQFADYNVNATRRQFAAILCRALPAEALEQKNQVEYGAIPDLAAGSANYEDIYLLYRAGILTGNDARGTFAPETTIGRSSVAAIVSRMAVPYLRQSITLVPAVLTGLSLSDLALETGKSALLSVTVTPSDATVETLSWTSSNTAVATVNNGTVTAVGAGTATITVSAGGISGSCTVTVTAPKPAIATYASFPSIPDFGAVLGISATTSTYDSSDGSGGYFYSYTAIKGSSRGEDFADLYDSALIASGFRFVDSFTNSDGGTTLIYTNGTYYVMMGVSMVGGVPGILIAITT